MSLQVLTYDNTGAFGELALMYNTPRYDWHIPLLLHYLPFYRYCIEWSNQPLIRI